MAVFTTELRTLCGAIVGASEHAGYAEIDEVISQCWKLVFSDSWNTYDPVYKEVLCRKILKHYWMREIGTETIDLFLHYLNTRLDEIMPYYNELYKSATLEFDPLHDYDLQTTSTRTTDGETTNQSTIHGTSDLTGSDSGEATVNNTGTLTRSDSGSATETSNGTVSGSKTGKTTDKTNATEQSINKYSDTPQGELSGVLNGTYLTNATVNDKTGSNNGERNSEDNTTETSNNSITETSESNISENNKQTSTESRESTKSEKRVNDSTASDSGTAKTTEDYVLSVKGKSGGKSFSTLLAEYRKTLINIDVMIIDELKDLFMGLWF